MTHALKNASDNPRRNGVIQSLSGFENSRNKRNNTLLRKALTPIPSTSAPAAPAISSEVQDLLIESAKARITLERKEQDKIRPALQAKQIALREAEQLLVSAQAEYNAIKLTYDTHELACIKHDVAIQSILDYRASQPETPAEELNEGIEKPKSLFVWMYPVTQVLTEANRFLTQEELWSKLIELPDVLAWIKAQTKADYLLKQEVLANLYTTGSNMKGRTKYLIVYKEKFGLIEWVDPQTGTPTNAKYMKEFMYT